MRKIEPFETEIKTFGYYVNRLLYALIKRQNQILADEGLELMHSEFIVLRVLGEINGLTQSQIASDMGMERSGISRTLATLEKKGYIERRLINGKTKVVTLTEKAEKLLPLLKSISDKLTQQAFIGFSPKKEEAFMNNLHKIYLNAMRDLK